MTVRELIGILQACQQDNVVAMALDEGQDHRMLADVSLGYWMDDGTFELSEDVKSDGEPNAVCFYPV